MDKEKFKFNFPPEVVTGIKRSDVIADKIKRLIVGHDMKPSDRLPPEKDFIKMFTSSRGTIREALKSLEVQGLIEIVPGRNGGARICAVPYRHAMQLLSNYLHFQELTGAQIFELRLKLEPLLAESVVELLSEDDFQALEKTIENGRSYLSEENWKSKVRDTELEFHNSLLNVVKIPFCPSSAFL